MYFATIDNSMYQYCDHETIIVGGTSATLKLKNKAEANTSGSAIYISNNFKTGRCTSNSETFGEHPLLSSKPDFKIKRFEVWGFADDYE